MDLPAKKPRACVPCHERKVRCDLTRVGTPCTRCVIKDRAPSCVVVSRPQPGAKRRRAPANRDTITANQTRGEIHVGSIDAGQDIDPVLTLVNMATRTPVSLAPGRGPNSQPSPHPPQVTPSPTSISSALTLSGNTIDQRIPQKSYTVDSQPQYTTSDEDAHLQTLCRMSQSEAVVLSPASADATEPTRRVFEYYSDFNALSLLNDAIGRPHRRRLVPVDLDGPQPGSVKDRELGHLDDVDRAYLAQRQVHDLPQRKSRDALMRLFYKHVYPYTPVVDRVQLSRDCRDRSSSTFLLYAIFAITAPYCPLELLHDMSFRSVTEAQREFFSRARLLYDFGCEKNQLTILQGSIFMSSFQNSFAPDKDFRFWFNSAIHIATLMGLHRQNIKRELHPAMHKVCRRIWWLLFQRDVMFSLAGFENVRLINDVEADLEPLCKEDWAEIRDTDSDQQVEALPAITNTQMQFFMENCKLTQLGARCLHLFHHADSVPSMDQIRSIGEAIVAWRNNLPAELRVDMMSPWSDLDVWVAVIHAFSYRLECLFYRTLRRRVNIVNLEDIRFVNQQLLGAMFELSTTLRRAMTHDVLLAGPPALIVCTTQLLSLQIETVLSPDCSRANRQALKAEIYTILAYLRDIEESWLNAKWAARVFGWVVDRTGISLGEVGAQQYHVSGASDPSGTADERPGGDSIAGSGTGYQTQQREDHDSGRQVGQDDSAAHQASRILDSFEFLPGTWSQEMIDQGVLEEQDQIMFDLFGAPFH